MILYSVTIHLQPAIEKDWLHWMQHVHIPDVLRTGCFLQCRIFKSLEPAGNEPVYVMQYHARTLDDYHRYRDHFAPALQKDHTDRYSGQFRGARSVMEELTP